MAACRQRECGGLAGREHRGCVRACRARSTCAAPGASIRTLAYAMSECRPDGALTTELPGPMFYSTRFR